MQQERVDLLSALNGDHSHNLRTLSVMAEDSAVELHGLYSFYKAVAPKI